MKIKILLVEDQYFARLAMHTVLESRPEMHIIAETANGAEAVALYQQHQPDVVIMDLRLPGLSGFAAIRALRAHDPAARIVVLSNYAGDEDVHQAITAGASAYLTKDAHADDLVQAVLTVQRGRQFLPPDLRALLRSRVPADELTNREREVLSLLAEGLSNRDIGDRLGIAEKTVRIHMTHLMDKLAVEDRTQAVLTALQRGLVHLD